MSVPLLQRRFVLVTGKGGVGKSTVTAVLARLAADAGRRTLVCELNTRERIPSLFGHRPVGGQVARIAENIWSVNIRPMMAMEEYGLMKLRFRALYKLVFDNPVISSLVRFVPGVNDLLMLGKAFNHERERDEDGRPRWDTILIDAPATGHGVSFFRLPLIIREAVPSGNMHREAAEMWALLTDPRRTAVHLVSLPEELPVRETLELHGTLSRDLGMPLGHLFVNKVPPPLLDAATGAGFGRLTEPPEDPDLRILWDATRIRLSREGMAERYIDELGSLGMPLMRLPIQYSARFGPAEVGALASAALAQGIE